MEQFLRAHPVLRTLLLLTILLCLVLEGLLLYRLAAPDTAGASPSATVTAEQIMVCRTVVGIRLREGPGIEYAVLADLPADTIVTATGRNGTAPWLAVRLNDGRSGWLSSRDDSNQPLVSCEGDMLQLPEVAPQGSPPPATETTTVPTLTASANVRLRTDNGPDLSVAQRTFEVAVDGRLDEWGQTSAAPIETVVYRPENWTGPEDLSGQVRAAWDGDNLILAIAATDDVIVQQNRQELLYRGDSVEVHLDLDLQGDFDDQSRSQDDVQIVLSPGNFVDRGPEAWVYFAPSDPAALTPQIRVRAQRTGSGYTLEATIPWAPLGITPRSGDVFGYAVDLSDNDTPGTSGQESMVATSKVAPFNRPTAWGNLVLE